MSSGPSLMTADAGAYRALGEGGEEVWRRAAQLRAAIDTRLGKRHADLFAIPHDQAGHIAWQAPFDGTPRPYAELSEAEKRALQSKVQELRPDLERLVDRLDAAGRSDGERAFGRLLRQALMTPGPETLFSVDSRPVLTFWGFTGAASPGVLLGIAAAPATTLPAWSAAPPPPPPAAPPPPPGWNPAPTPPPAQAAAPAGWPPGAAAPPGAPPYGAPPGAPTQMAPPPGTQADPAAPPTLGAPPPTGPAPGATMAAVAPPAAGNWWKWLLIATFLLLLLAVAAYLVKPYLPRWVWDGKFTLPSTARSGPGGPGGVDDAALRAEQAREAALRADYAQLSAQFNEKRNQCVPGRQGTVVPGTGDTTVVPGSRADAGKPGDGTTTSPAAPDGTTPRTADAAKPPADARQPPDGKPPAAAPRPPADPKTAAKPDAKPETKPAGQPPPQQAARPTVPPAGQKPDGKPIEPVQIPREPGVRFMQGDWRSSTDLTTQSGDEVIRPQYTFDKDGKGKTRIVQKNGVVCEGPAQASRDGSGKLIIKETEALSCSDGTTYAPSTVTCEPGRDGRAQCQGRTEGGPTYAVQLGK